MTELRPVPTTQITTLRAAHDDFEVSNAPDGCVGAQSSLCTASSAKVTNHVCKDGLSSSSQCCTVPVPRHSQAASMLHMQSAAADNCYKTGWHVLITPPGHTHSYIGLLLPGPLSSHCIPLTKRSPSSSSATISSSTSFKPFKPPKGVPAPLLLPLATSETTPWLGPLDTRDLRRESYGT